MQKVFLLFLSIAIVQVLSAERLIQFNSTYTVWMNEEDIQKLSYERESGFMDITDYPVIDYSNRAPPTYPNAPTQQSIVQPLLGQLRLENLRATVAKLSSYTTRYYTSNTGVEAAKWLAAEYKAISNGVEYANDWPQPSVIARIPGNGPLANELVIIGAHIDSTSNGNVAPGADDNASGTATTLEVFRVLIAGGFKPRRTLEFHGYSAEEVGLRGSQAIANAYAKDGRVVYAMLNMDMTGYVQKGTTPNIGLETSFTDPELTNFISKLKIYTPTPILSSSCGYACSDHASFTRANYPAGRISESIQAYRFPERHTIYDTIDKLDFAHNLEVAKVALAFAVELSNAQ